jgi:K+-sensing histidine kinase KdpD
MQQLVEQVPSVLRSSLSVIQGYTESMATGVLKGGEQQHGYQVIEKHCKRIADYLDDFTTLSRFQQKPLRLQLTDFHPRCLVEDSLEHLAAMIQARQAEISFNISRELPLIHGDRCCWDQVITRILERLLADSTEEVSRISIKGQLSGRRLCLSFIADQALATKLPAAFTRCQQCEESPAPPQHSDLVTAVILSGVRALGGSLRSSLSAQQLPCTQLFLPLRM